MKHCIEYVIGLLFLENARNLESILKRVITEGSTQKTLEKKCASICEFLKHEYEMHLDTDEDVAHDTKRACPFSALIGCVTTE